jgi:hypothetical protein
MNPFVNWPQPKPRYKLLLDGRMVLDQAKYNFELKELLIKEMPMMLHQAHTGESHLNALLRKQAAMCKNTAAKTATSQITAMRKNTARKGASV